MRPVRLVILWHMHQPQYRDPVTGRYILPWTRLHALKDYWGMVRVLEEFPGVHATYNVVPSLAAQLAEYASGKFDEPWFTLAFTSAEKLTLEDKAELIARGFQANQDNLIRRWPRYAELFDRSRAGSQAALHSFGLRDWRDLQFLSQLAWMDEEVLARDPDITRLSAQGADFTEQDKALLRAKQIELLSRVLPEYRSAQDAGQIEISTTPFYHPILPLLCDSSIAREANSGTLLPQPPFRRPEDAREQLLRARHYHESLFGRPPAGLWPSEGSVSDQALALAAEVGFQWFATDEGVLGRTFSIGFGRNAAGLPENADRLYAPLCVQSAGREITGLFRDHYLSDLVGFVYSRMDEGAAAEDLHRRLRAIGENVQTSCPLTVSLILDGENAWEYYHHNGREFLRQFYRRIQDDPDIRALTVSEALRSAGELESAAHIFPASWINANFDIWIGHSEDVAGWNLLRDARDFYADKLERRAREGRGPSYDAFAQAYEALLAAEGSDWFWWFGPENSSANDAEFDAFFRKLLSEVYRALGAEAPDALAEPIKRQAERAEILPPAAFLDVRVDGRDTTYFEWMGSGHYAPDRRENAMHGRARLLRLLRYGFSDSRFFVRVDLFDDIIVSLADAEFRVTLDATEELRVIIRVLKGKIEGYLAEAPSFSILGPDEMLTVASDRFLEISIGRRLIPLAGRSSFSLMVALWEGGLPMDVLPAQGSVEVRLGAENFGWDVQPPIP
jgi:alpha-amylase/alpha-mannosidase (GH57 family)